MRKLAYLLAIGMVLAGQALSLFAAPAPPTLSFPLDQRATAIKTPVLDWTDVADSTYTVQVATSADFAVIKVSSAGLVSSSYTLTGAEALGRDATYYWHVRASSGTGDGVFSSTSSFYISFNRVVASTLEVATTTAMDLPLKYSKLMSPAGFTGLTQYTLAEQEALVDGTTYYWRARAWNAGGGATVSSTFSFVVGNSLSKPILLSPAPDKRVLTQAPLLDWSDVAGASTYTVYLSSYSDFSFVKISSAGIASGSQYQVLLSSGLTNLTTFYWRVTATAGANMSFSTTSAFYIETVSPASLIFPLDQRQTAFKTPTFQWSIPASLRDLSFTLEWADNNGMTGASSQTGISTGTYLLSSGQQLARGATYYWRVKTIDPIGTNIVSSTSSFTITFNRIAYTLDVDTTNVLSDPLILSKFLQSTDFITPTTNQYSLTVQDTLADGATYYWRVRAKDDGGNTGLYASTSSFVVNGPVKQPVLLSPAPDRRVISQAPLLDWTDAAGATSYSVYVSSYSDFSFVKISSAGIASGSQYQVLLSSGLTNLTTFYWRVTATDGANVSFSTTSAFYIETVSAPGLMFPRDQGLLAMKTPTFQWSIPTSLRDLTFTLEWATNNGMTGASSQTGISTGTYLLSSGQQLARSTTYYWRVTTVDLIGTNIVSSTSSFNITLNHTIASTLELATTSVMGAPLVFSKFMYDNQYTPAVLEALADGVVYYWRARGWNEGGNAGLYASTFSFTVNSALKQPVLVSPAPDKRILTQAPLLDWTDVAGATSYSVDVSSYIDFSFTKISSAGIISGSQYQVLLSSGLTNITTFYWRVAATDGSNVSFSTISAFYIETVSPASQIFPLDQRQTAFKTPAFQWSIPASLRDLNFTLEWATNNGMTGASSQTGISTGAYRLSSGQQLARDATYYWRVKTVDPIGTNVVSSTSSFYLTFNRVVASTLEVATTAVMSAPLTFSKFMSPADFIAATQYTLAEQEALVDGAVYYWRARAWNAGGGATVPSTFSFVVGNALTKPQLLSPAQDKRILTQAPLLDWSDVAGASTYTVYLSSYSDFSFVKISSAGIASGSQYQVLLSSGLTNLTTFYWRVTATAGANMSFSTTSAFYIETISPASLIFPLDQRQTAFKTPTFQWSIPASLRDLTFTLEWADNNNMTGASSQTGISTGTYLLSSGQQLARGATYYWRVRTIDPIGTNIVSSTSSFTITLNRITYNLEVDLTTPLTDPLMLSKSVKSGDMIAPTTNQYQLIEAEALSGGTTYYWHVRARDEGGNTGPYSGDFKFRIPGGWFTAVGVSSLTVNWDSTSPPDTVYYIKLSTAPDFMGNVMSSSTVNLWAEFQNLMPNTIYFAASAPAVDAATTTYNRFGSASTLALPVSGEQIYRVFYTSVTFNWLPLPVSPSSSTCEGYKVELSTAADFTGAIFSSVTVNVNLSTLTVAGLGCGVEYYARLGSRNWGGAANYNIAGSTETQTWDCGLRFFDGTQNVVSACEYPGVLTSRFRIFNKGINFGVILIDPAKPKASRWRIMTPEGVRALRKYP